MASSYLTPTAVTRAIARVLHQKGKFINRINRQYDAQYADNGQRKGGGSIKIRMPNEYTVRTGTTMNVQDVSEVSETLTIATMKGVDMNFNDTDLALSIEDFSERFIEPAVAVLVSAIEADAYTGCINKVANMVADDGTAFGFTHVAQAQRKLWENLAPVEDQEALSLFVSPMHNSKLVIAQSTVYNPQSVGDKQYRSGMMQPLAGVGGVFVTTHATDLTTGTNAKGDTTYDVNETTAGDDGTVTITTGSGTFLTGEVVELAGSNAVHPETKADLGYRKQFVVTADSGASATSLSISTGIVGNVAVHLYRHWRQPECGYLGCAAERFGLRH